VISYGRLFYCGEVKITPVYTFQGLRIEIVVYVESINEIIKIDRPNETFLALLSCGAALFSMF